MNNETLARIDPTIFSTVFDQNWENVLQTLAEVPIAVPFHSIIGQHHPGPVETSSDGVVSYLSAHLEGAASEFVVQSDHGVTNKPAAQAEIKRILRLELQRR
jgi:hypothetical protein